MAKLKENAKVVMLPTNEPSKIGNLATYQKRSLAKVIKEGINPIGSTVQFWNLYIISDDEIKEGDYYIIDDIPELLKNNGLKFIDDYCKKVIATTDTSLYTHQKETVSLPERVFYLPQPSQQFIEKFIEEYNKGNVITDVLVEYEVDKITNACTCKESLIECPNRYYDGIDECCSKKFPNGEYWDKTFKLKVNPKDHTITIKKLKETYNKEELCQILEKYTSFLWSEVGIHYPISLGNDAKDILINSEL